ncbi:MAG: ATP synthase F1 subunit gamma [Actinomycetota bacterium]|nr:ATP synthase F1 subunit gamma [Actinomycetota bacterium]
MSLQDLKRQIQSVKNTAKMTQALQTISAIKLNKARAHLDRARPYTDNVEEMMRDIADRAQSDTPLLVGRDEVNNVAICTVTSDRGLAGAFNAQVLRRTMSLRQEQSAEIVQVATGRKAREFFKFRRMNLDEVYVGFSDSPSYEKAREIGQRLTQLFEDEEADEVYLVYNRFHSALAQRATVTRILPIASEDEEDGEEEDNTSDIPFEFIPEPEELLERLVPKYVETLVFRALLESAAGEHGARMTAMQSATEAANEMADELTMQMNKMRQAAITQEIIEIASAAEALGS